MPVQRRRNIPIKRYYKAYGGFGNQIGPKFVRSRRRNLFNQTAHIKLRVVATIASNAGGQIQFSYTNNPSSFRDWTSLANLYDEYRVTGMKFQFFPYLPNDTSTVTGFLPIYHVYDCNSITNPLASVNDAIEYENMKAFNMYKPWKIYRKLERPTSTATTVVNAGGYIPTAVPTATSICAFYGDGFDISTSYGSVVVTCYMKLRMRK